MGNRNYKNLIYIVILTLASSCVGGKYAYEFDTGKNLDFSNGKWIFNEVSSNSESKNNKRLYGESYEEFRKILGDSLIDLTSLRNISLVEPEIKFEPDQSELKELYKNSKCDFLINVRGQIISNNASSFYSNDQNLSYSTSNRSAVFIKIFDLKNGILISSSNGKAISTEEHSDLEKDGSLNWTTRAEPMMVRAAEGLIMKYNKYRTDK
ncbi:hypothetical protein Celal_3324 [Cellulophaga algicola DSM 14237]|uniref:Lipoprotein n=1 Tax=Cellulophaga algicola (strain DSM 14237 / IC166 / ACAM 630) TaxID=688270 RepID=E6X631_CELAD|nr:hypothetical protein [Cellulophaga algicola]ADV50590.1 hypothetical protein Celal_3324 [Cellulophaga algicola DSM 14237]